VSESEGQCAKREPLGVSKPLDQPVQQVASEEDFFSHPDLHDLLKEIDDEHSIHAHNQGGKTQSDKRVQAVYSPTLAPDREAD
jgi:hypothetical protein